MSHYIESLPAAPDVGARPSFVGKNARSAASFTLQVGWNATLSQMKAALYDRYGGPDVLYEGAAPVPTPKPGEVLVRVHAASVNGIDLIVRAGTLKLLTGRTFPRRTGLDFAGEVAGLGARTSLFKVGDRVWGALPNGQTGSAAEYVCVLPEQLSLSPSGLDDVEAAALPVVGSTVITALRDIGRLKAGERLLIRGASGGVGSVAVQLGRSTGAHVTALASASNLEFVRGLGADRVFDYATTRPGELGTFDVILDTVGSELRPYRALLAPNGRMASIVPDPKHPIASMLYTMLSRIHGGRRVRFFSDKPNTQLLAALAAYVESGAIRPIVDKVYPLSAIADAHAAMQSGGRRGKQIVRVLGETSGSRNATAATPGSEG